MINVYQAVLFSLSRTGLLIESCKVGRMNCHQIIACHLSAL